MMLAVKEEKEVEEEKKESIPRRKRKEQPVAVLERKVVKRVKKEKDVKKKEGEDVKEEEEEKEEEEDVNVQRVAKRTKEKKPWECFPSAPIKGKEKETFESLINEIEKMVPPYVYVRAGNHMLTLNCKKISIDAGYDVIVRKSWENNTSRSQRDITSQK